MSVSLRCLLSSIVIVAALSATGTRALGCWLCRALGNTAYHQTIGGDDFDDALQPPSDPASETPYDGMANAQFVQQGGTFPQPGGLGTPVYITFSFNNLLDGTLKSSNQVPLPVSLIRGSVIEALRLWASVAPLNFREVPDQGGGPFLSDYPDGQFGEIRFSHVRINGPDIPGQPPIAKAQAVFHSAGGNIASDVFFDNSDPWQEVGTLSEPDIFGAAIHEIGHTLGLGHTDVYDPEGLMTPNMYWIFHRFSGLGTGASLTTTSPGFTRCTATPTSTGAA